MRGLRRPPPAVRRRRHRGTHRGGLRHRRTLHAVRHRRAKRIGARRHEISVTYAVTTGAMTAARRRVRRHAARRRLIIAIAGHRRAMPIEVHHREISAICGAMIVAMTADRLRGKPPDVRRRIIAIAGHRHAMPIAARRHGISVMRAAIRVTTGGLRVRRHAMHRRRATIVARRRAITATPAATTHVMIAVRRRAKPHAAGRHRAITEVRRPATVPATPRIAAPCCANMSAMPAASSRSSGNLAPARRRGFRRRRATASLTIAASANFRAASGFAPPS